MAVEIGTLVLKGRFGPAREEAGAAANRDDINEALEEMRHDLLREMEERIADAARRARER
ncbi:hypothetical protein [Roseobacter sp. S98]|uniref:hypothetical protein n=1 Tax=Roseobacter algicola (ex Choi et al. 2025) (nom. illeg.) TaxID=3092138 RepID=UPI0035C6C6A3